MKIKYSLLILILSLVSYSSYTQSVTHTESINIKLLCNDLTTNSKVYGTTLDTVEYEYEQRLWELAGAKMGVDNVEIAIQKITVWWNKYKKKCICDSVVFNVPNGSILKFAITKNRIAFIETLAWEYGLDINFIDPADGRNLIDYLNDEILNMGKTGASKSSIEVYTKYRDNILELGGKASK